MCPGGKDNSSPPLSNIKTIMTHDSLCMLSRFVKEEVGEENEEDGGLTLSVFMFESWWCDWGLPPQFASFLIGHEYFPSQRRCSEVKPPV